MKVLIVEDEEILCRVLSEKLRKANLEVETASDGIRALQLIREIKPHIVILDIILPKKNGLSVLKEIKSDPNLKKIPVVILSNLEQDEEIKTALRLGADDYIVKTQHPINEVVEKIKSHLVTAFG